MLESDLHFVNNSLKSLEFSENKVLCSLLISIVHRHSFLLAIKKILLTNRAYT